MTLLTALKTACPNVTGYSSDGRLDYADGSDPTQLSNAKAILATYVSDPVAWVAANTTTYDTTLGWSMGIDPVCMADYNNDSSTLAIYQAFMLTGTASTINLSATFSILDCNGNYHTTTVGNAITIYKNFWSWYQTL